MILASASPRRRELLERAGFRFEVIPSDFDEGAIDPSSMPPHALAQYLAMKKAEDVAVRHPDGVVIAADTFIAHEGQIMGKPHTPEEARRMLGALGGRTHSVITGYAIVHLGSRRELVHSVQSRVTFKELTPDEINAYIATGEPLDKAGAYAIQGIGARLIASLDGDLDNVIGLPVADVIADLRTFGIGPISIS